MKISEVTIADLKGYLNVFHDDDDTLLTTILTACRAYISAHTGITADILVTPNLDSYEDLTMALYVLASELYDNRAYNVEAAKNSPVVEAILNIHSVNLL